MVARSLLSASALVSLALAASSDSPTSLTLSANVISKGSFFTGQEGLGAETGEAESLTSQNNFIDFCSGQTITNGLQIIGGSCNPIPMGQIPSKNTMISTVFTTPQDGDKLGAGQTFNISVQINNLEAGFFTNADATYYAAPQQINSAGQVQGHTHITCQDMGNTLNPTTPPDPTLFAFFKGINDAGNGQGLLTATVTDGLEAGNYRCCTLTSAANHQPVLMPVAQRGSQDDCVRFTVQGSGGSVNEDANDGTAGDAAAALVQSAVDLGPGAITTGAAGAAAATATAAASTAAAGSTTNNAGSSTNNAGTSGSKSGKGSKGGKGGAVAADSSSSATADAAATSTATTTTGGDGTDNAAASSTTSAAAAAATSSTSAAAAAATSSTTTTGAESGKGSKSSSGNFTGGRGGFRSGGSRKGGRMARLHARTFVA